MQTPERIEQSLRQFIDESFPGTRQGRVIEATTPLLADDILDSMGVLELLSFIEERFGVTVADSEAVGANLGSIDALVRFVAAKLTAAITSVMVGVFSLLELLAETAVPLLMV